VADVSVSVPALGGAAATGAAVSPVDLLIARLERLPFTRRHWLVAAVLCTATFFDGFDGLVIQSALPLILTAMGVSLASAGVIVSAQFWGGVIGGLSAGILAERYGRRRVLLASCGILGLTSIFVAFAQDFNQLVLARTVQGAAGAMEIPIAGAMFNEFVKSSHRGTAVYVYETMYAWGGYVAP